MLPNLRTILAAMCLTAIAVVLVGAALMPRPDPYGRSTAFTGVGPSDNSESQLLRKLGYTRRADELNRLLTLPAPTDDSVTSEGGISTYVKQGGSDTVVSEQTVADAKEQRADPIVTGTVRDKTVATELPAPSTASASTEAVAPSTEPAAKVASTRPDAGESENTPPTASDAPITVLPPPRPKLTSAIRHRALAERSAITENAHGSETANSDLDTSSLNHTDPRSARPKMHPPAPIAPVSAERTGRDINIP
jgi:hypothetical protein